MSACIIAIDIGVTGAAVRFGPDGIPIEFRDLPTLEDGAKGRRAINAPLLAELVRIWTPRRAYIEYVGPRPGEGAVQGFSFGRSKGVIEGVLGAFAVPIVWLTPPVWKRIIGLPAGPKAKDAARSEALRRWPQHAAQFGRAMDHNRAEAALIGVAGMMREGGP